MRDQCVHQRAELAVHRFGELMQSEIDAMIGDAILGKIVSANLFRAIAGLDLATALRSELATIGVDLLDGDGGTVWRLPV